MTENNTNDDKTVKGEVLDSHDEPVKTVRLPSKRTMKRFALGAIGAGAALFAANRLGKKSGYDEAVDAVEDLSTPEVDVTVTPEV
jgi:hypothetical protein